MYSGTSGPAKKQIPRRTLCKEGGMCKKCEEPVVRCEYTKAEESLSHLVEESFRLYLSRILSVTGKPAASYGR